MTEQVSNYDLIKRENNDVAGYINRKVGTQQVKFHYVNFNDRKLEKMMGIKPSHIPDFEINTEDSNLKKVHDGLSNDQIFSMLTPEEAKIYFYSTSLNHTVWNRIRNSVVQLVRFSTFSLNLNNNNHNRLSQN